MGSVISYHMQSSDWIQFRIRNPFNGEAFFKTLPVTLPQLMQWANGAFIQDAMPQLSAGDREILISGIDEATFDALFADSDEDQRPGNNDNSWF